jgi:hypothetical protein
LLKDFDEMSSSRLAGAKCIRGEVSSYLLCPWPTTHESDELLLSNRIGVVS